MSRDDAAALLGVPADADPAAVQHAYLRAARRTHPDLLTDADETERRAAADAFDALTRARDLLVESAPVDPLQRATWAVRPDAPPPRAPQRGLGGPLVVLALLGFLLMGIVVAEHALLGQGVPAPAVSANP
ncbi:J domain-containing protein [Amnibacterium kyonggiense]|nr:J domain-containing protein [Amnibacterium kyonggiense]